MSTLPNFQEVPTPEKFQSLLSEDLKRVSLINFWAPWAAPCTEMNKVVLELAKLYPDLLVLQVRILSIASKTRIKTWKSIGWRWGTVRYRWVIRHWSGPIICHPEGNDSYLRILTQLSSNRLWKLGTHSSKPYIRRGCASTDICRKDSRKASCSPQSNLSQTSPSTWQWKGRHCRRIWGGTKHSSQEAYGYG